MIPLLVGAFTVAGVGLGWMGHKVNTRIAAWGEKMNEIDDIFRETAESEEAMGITLVRTRPTEEVRGQKTYAGHHHFPTGPVA